ncbi:uncharacterized protein HMPREF1541_06631 [Cyphellophora europaea CBS 101466]|uniref:Zn(2)-C6 fungal-type domain-containing protein n=1 Tax=Cyphellophora europaea (strain CBS 101466) TaxID=1220924 RepID=W2RS98_CYPE1|nr:uncharacterized protein HMPREF1541_06631 [Cyphellophora europaea CBS 101466]ETN38594.1 hypothetical protein HMPREF1541_06631 [Cyphellophora europaea CBS 101466]
MAPQMAPDMKPMRKGTRSCRECRRRKIKCNWSSPTAPICNECTKHDRTCHAQGYIVDRARVEKPDTLLKIKVNRIESIVERLAKMQHEQSVVAPRDENGCSFERVQKNIIDGAELEEHAKKASPLFGLFNNEVIKQKDGNPAPHLDTTSTISFRQGDISDLDKLKSTIAQDPDILDVLDAAQEWWISWRDQQWVIRESGVDPTVRSFVQSRLDSDDPVVYATGLMCIAMSLHRIRPGMDDVNLNLSVSARALFDRIVTAIDQVVLTRQPQGSASILLALQRAKTHAEGDQLRKSWLRIRHAILLTQHLDFANDLEVGQDELMYRQRWVGGVYEMDHFMSLVLGFPHARDKNFTDRLAKLTLMRGDGDVTVKMRALRRITAVVAGRVNERNANADGKIDKALTCSIQEDMMRFGAMMPQSWWDVEAHVVSNDAQSAHEHVMAQMWYWQIQSFLHLPHMLETDDPEHHQSRVLCLQACRHMLRVFCVLRGTPALSVYVCSCEDFQGVITSAILLIGVLLGISEEIYPSVESLEEDFAILEEVKDIFRYRATMQGGSISRQGLKVVETLESFLMEGSGGANDDRSRSIILPYFGLIRIESQVPPMHAARQQMEQLDLTALEEYSTQPGSLSANYLHDDSSAINSYWNTSVEHESPLFNSSSGHPSNGSLSTNGASDEVFDKPLPADKTYADFNPPIANVENLESWDQFLYGDELAQDWDIPGWESTFNDWNEDLLSHAPMPRQ